MSNLIETLRAALNPRAVAVVGASADPAKFGGRVMRFLLKHGYEGRIVPVNPSGAEILGIPSVKDVREAGGAIDVALLAAPSQQLAAAVEQCGAAGVRCCVVITADFAELGEEGAARERELVGIARRHGMRLIGPNCLGFINPGAKLALTSSVALSQGDMPRGAIGLISQSGSMMASMISHAADCGAGFSACVTVGNQADLEICDFIEYFVEDDATRAICVYVEGLKDARRFLALAQRCREAGKPLLAVKAGSSDAGSHIARSHTASLAGSHAAWKAACAQTGVITVDDPEAMIDCARFLVSFPRIGGSAVAVISPSGGTIAVTADRVAAAGLTLAQPTPATCEALRALVPEPRPFNPLDVGGLPRERGVSAAEDAQALLSADPNVGVVLIVVATTPQLEEKVRRWGAAALASGKPTVILFTPGRLVDGARAALREIGCPYADRMDDALRVVRAAIDYRAAAAAPPERPSAPDWLAHVDRTKIRAGQLTESEAKALVRVAGIASPEEALAADADAAVQAAERIGYPVVLKGVSRDVVHKSDVGAVKLGLRDSDAVRAAYAQIEASVRRHGTFEGCSVQRMIAGGVEMIVGARHDAQFGPVVLVGAGGVFVEVLKDTAVALAPLTRDRARELVRSLRIWPLLDGARGRPRLAVDALADAIVNVSWLAHALGPALVELDLNPLLVQENGVIALDARATVVKT
ncbi:MAG TPA: acetate--CoA ligase family protein [Burkholderiales bacterium]|nr:acetate--CoA ligase family protein [Burkholderiales bacterium]